MIIGTALAILGSFLPWANVSGGDEFWGTPSVDVETSGLEGDGILTLILAIVALVLGIFGFLRWSKGFLIGSLVTSVLVTLIAIIDIADVSDKADKVSGIIDVSVGVGLWFVLIGGIVGIVGASIGLAKNTI